MPNIKQMLQGKRIKSEEIKQGVTLKLLNGGEWVKPKGEGKTPFLNFTVLFNGEEREMVFNKKSLNAFSGEWGMVTEEWAGNWVKCIFQEYLPQFQKNSNIFGTCTTQEGKELDTKASGMVSDETKEAMNPENVEWEE